MANNGPCDLAGEDYWCCNCDVYVSTPDGIHPGNWDYKTDLSEPDMTKEEIEAIELPTYGWRW